MTPICAMTPIPVRKMNELELIVNAHPSLCDNSDMCDRGEVAARHRGGGQRCTPIGRRQ